MSTFDTSFPGITPTPFPGGITADYASAAPLVIGYTGPIQPSSSFSAPSGITPLYGGSAWVIGYTGPIQPSTSFSAPVGSAAVYGPSAPWVTALTGPLMPLLRITPTTGQLWPLPGV
jgi:hypothetical protein